MVTLHSTKHFVPHISVDVRQCSSGLSGFVIGTGHGQCRSGTAKQLLSPSVRARSQGVIHLMLIFQAAYELEFLFYFCQKRPLIFEGMKFHPELQASLHCFNKAKYCKLHIFMCIFCSCKRLYFLL